MSGASVPGSQSDDHTLPPLPDDEDAGTRLRKAPTAFRTISEVADELHVPQHVLRFWETRFAEVRPLKRGGGRRYYRPDDVDLLRRISDLLYVQGYTIKGVQRVLREGDSLPAETNAAETDNVDEAEYQTSLLFAHGTGALDPRPESELAEPPLPPEEIPEMDDGECAPLDDVPEDTGAVAEDAAYTDALRRLAEENTALREGLRMVLEELQALRRHIPV